MTRTGALALLFLLSGAGALVAETVWLRWMRGLLGATAPATAATLLAFFAGNALGAIAAGRLAGRWRHPLRAYAAVELLAVACAAAVPALLALGAGAIDSAYDGLRDSPGQLAAVRFAVALAATLPAAVCFGASFPTLGAAALASGARLGSTGVTLYAVNTLGAALGAAAGAFFLVEAFGVRGSYAAGLLATGAAGIGALALSAREAPRAPTEDAGNGGGGSLTGPASVAFVSGFGTLAAQVLLVQSHAQVLNQSVHAFGVVLVVTLAALALGAALAGTLARRAGPPEQLIGDAAVAAALTLAAFPPLFWHLTDGLAFSGAGAPWPAYLFACLGLAVVAAGPPLLAGGLVFPLTLAWAAERRPDAPAGRLIGALLAANTAGAMVGSIAAPFLLLPRFGPWGAFVAVAIAYVLVVFGRRDRRPTPRRTLRIVVLAGGWATLFSLASPLETPLLRLAPGETARSAVATAAGVVAVIERDGERLIRTDNHYSLGGTGEIVHQERQGHVPMLLHPKARSVVHAGSASGISAGALLAHPVERIRLVEIVPAVAHAGARDFADANRGVHRDPRVEVVLDDAGNYLAHTRERFDVVIADLFVPWRAGTGALYSREHFQSVRDRLEADGLFCQWLPLYQLGAEEFHVIVATFLDVFPQAGLFRGDFYGRYPIVALVGYRDGPAPAAAVEQAVARLARSGERDRWVTDVAGFWSLYAGPLGPIAPSLAQTPRNTVDRPVLEYLAARHHQGGSVGLAHPFVGFAWQRFSDGLRAAAVLGNPLYPDLDRAAMRARAGGSALQMAGALWTEGRSDEAARAITVAADLLPDHLLANAPPDQTAADLWPDNATTD